MGKYEENDISGYQLDNQGIKLEENEFYETKIGKFDGMMMYMGQHGEKTSGLIDLYFEDSKGKRYIIKDAKQNIKKLRCSKHRFGVRSHS